MWRIQRMHVGRSLLWKEGAGPLFGRSDGKSRRSRSLPSAFPSSFLSTVASSDSRALPASAATATAATTAAAEAAAAILASRAKCFAVLPEDIAFLDSPAAFYNDLLARIQRAEKRVVLSSLYLGTKEKEQRLVRGGGCMFICGLFFCVR